MKGPLGRSLEEDIHSELWHHGGVVPMPLWNGLWWLDCRWRIQLCVQAGRLQSELRDALQAAVREVHRAP